ncbi:hypothetical protein [Nocardioides acrostichi]|uniref:Sulfotransferase family protein n=1 Tax=Nocardioides acrostichi TaxID=2784339 RepID=A0A930UY79_9ACTN|nr:hypothetical protein [Nocardioides acrostichi]MBF4161892.1 hypothetical protein [Nocardioides acrostichi]
MRPVYLHIGLQKTGTSYLQRLFLGSAEQLAGHGFDVVPDQRRSAYWLMLDVRDRLKPHDPAQAREVLAGLAQALSDAGGRAALVSEESLSPAEDAQIERLLAACAAGDREPHVVLSVRDLARQIPSVWQQLLQSGRTITYPHYVRRLREVQGTDAPIWRQKDIAAVVDKWARHVPPERIHVVTVPPPGSDQTLLLRRYCSVLGVEPDWLVETDPGRANRGLRLEQSEVLRRVNDAIPENLFRRDLYGDIGKRWLSVQVLGGTEGRRILLPAEHAEWCQETSRGYVEHLRTSGVDVVGELEDLLPRPESIADDDQEVSEEQVAQAAVAALSTIVNTRLERGQEASSPAGPEAEETLAPGAVRSLVSRLRGR